MAATRELKKKLRELLSWDDFGSALKQIKRFPEKQVVSPLFSFFYNKEPLVRWHAVTAMGSVVSRLADHDMESARVVMRRFMWNLNDESGGIGWGSPEAMGEVMSESGPLAKEYNHILLSYIRPTGNYIEHEILQRGVLWGLGRLAHARPQLYADQALLLVPYLQSSDPHHCGLAAWASQTMNIAPIRPHLENLLNSPETIFLYLDRKLLRRSVKELARQSLQGRQF